MELILDLVKAFLVGGAFCLVGQILIDYTKLTPARILVLYVVLGVALGAVGLYEPLRRIFGAGVGVPLLGFGGTIAEGVRLAVREKGFLGALTGPLTASAGGISAAILFGYLAALLGKSRPKRL